jgi:hypothetical protein
VVVFPAFRDDRQLNVLGKPENLGDQGFCGNQLQSAGRRAGHENLRNLMAVSKIDECRGRILTMQYTGFDVKIAREVQMLFNRLTNVGLQLGQFFAW